MGTILDSPLPALMISLAFAFNLCGVALSSGPDQLSVFGCNTHRYGWERQNVEWIEVNAENGVKDDYYPLQRELHHELRSGDRLHHRSSRSRVFQRRKHRTADN